MASNFGLLGFRLAALGGALVTACVLAAVCYGSEPPAIYPVGVRLVEYTDTHYGDRTMAMAVFYPAVVGEGAAPFAVPFFIRLSLYKDAEMAFDGTKHPLVMFSHGRGSNGFYYAWFAQRLASHGYIVAAPYHYRANTYDATIAYLANRLWQRPVDVSLDISFLLNDPFWGKYINPDRIGVAGHSQGEFTALWLGGPKVNPEKYLAFQKGWRIGAQMRWCMTASRSVWISRTLPEQLGAEGGQSVSERFASDGNQPREGFIEFENKKNCPGD